jgi:CDP-paratose 2-epimerase
MRQSLKILITGGCGFIGTNAAAAFCKLGHEVTILDDLSRPCSGLNLEWLREQGRFDYHKADVRDSRAVDRVVQNGRFDVALHLAAQVAVTASVKDPLKDFEINAGGTFNVLEAIRRHSPETIFLNASTNKVYGKLNGLKTRELKTRYRLMNGASGIAESQPLEFHSPYGCSKGAADQYTMDYARIYGLRTINFRQSCIYGLRQFGVEDQGWVAWFTIAHEFRKPITVYGTGKQVRDLLFVDDLIDCYVKAVERIDRVSGMTVNIGGGESNALSIVQFLDLLGKISGRPVEYGRSDWRPGDQPFYVSDNRLARKLLDWEPRVGVREGISRLHNWVLENASTLKRAASTL